jgi:hypothetical protein
MLGQQTHQRRGDRTVASHQTYPDYSSCFLPAFLLDPEFYRCPLQPGVSVDGASALMRS